MFDPVSTSVSFISIDWLSPLVKSLAPFAKILAHSRRSSSSDQQDRPDKSEKQAEELRKIGNIFGHPVDLARYYVEPDCQHHNPADRAEDLQPISAIRGPAFITIDNFLKGDYRNFADGSRQMFVLSDAGMGKTSLLMMIKLIHLFAFWPKCYDCLLLKLGEDTLATVAEHPDKANTVLLLDALDEDPLAWGDIEARLLAILAATDKYRRVIISCRTQFFPETASDPFGRPGRVQIGAYTCPMIFLALFDGDQVTRYLAKRFPNRLRIFPNPMRKRAQQLLLGMQSLRFRPLLLAHIHDILAEAKAAETRQWNSYTLYEALIEIWLAREEKKLRHQFSHPPDRKALWAICATVALALQREGARVLSRAALDELVKGFPLMENIEHFDVGGRSLLNRNADGDFRFSHYSIQEFLVAHSLLGERTGNLAAIPVDEIRVTDQLREFLVVSGKEMDLVLRKLLYPDEYWMDFSLLKGLNPGDRSMPEYHFYDTLSDGNRGPPMQWIPAGEFLMGSPKNEKGRESNEGPQHRVRIADAFALGTYPVTFTEYDRFCAATGRKKPGDSWGRERHPVINVSWQEAREYCAWLSRETGHRYRLASEVEWEYAARAGTRTRYWWGDEPGANRANCDGCGSQWDGRQTSPVGSFAANPFGLYDTAGNVWEWTLDCWHEEYRGAPTDGYPWEAGDCSRRVIRGGAWSNSTVFLRSADRNGSIASGGDSSLGFRLARVL
uniref:Formylglycine-generating enzyme, required for sulfatase activity, contains SUMF1/FGE domain n=1 Tax=Candidatus Kentrum eta TaxID=2126337 RepID=A0A450UVZ0_9GAMM|nr:MAG: Formylglycine-generating enzyme, required for sulfatase activity, contains SUMF1/FGE domain [Candidatus Kentron sp. H]VFJ96696.1 MAG: Formylglycine-generating enzyme, required for sulfatase activity, contains SUMF1/FGE domain [Candidatus Kentron sp. H]VFJ97617.1 MAG: Formylglycine-generating enzyme, required for sulfatase activity, contains SUMF1/FGE domain [Candidatus Kentron sp. H]